MSDEWHTLTIPIEPPKEVVVSIAGKDGVMISTYRVDDDGTLVLVSERLIPDAEL